MVTGGGAQVTTSGGTSGAASVTSTVRGPGSVSTLTAVGQGGISGSSATAGNSASLQKGRSKTGTQGGVRWWWTIGRVGFDFWVYMNTSPGLILVDDDQAVCDGLVRALHRVRPQWRVHHCCQGEQALELLQASPCDVLISDFGMPGQNGLDLIAAAKRINPALDCFLLTGIGDYDLAVRALNSGQVSQYFTKPCAISEIVHAVEVGIERHKAGLASLSGMGRAALEALSTGVFVIERDTGLILHTNQVAERVLAHRDGLHRNGKGVLCLSNSHDDDAFRALLREHDTDGSSTPSFMSFTRPSGLASYCGVIKNMDEEGRALVVLVSDPSERHAPPPQALIDLFGLTPSEALIAHTLAQGESLEHAALTSGITVSSARTYLKRVFAKTQTRSQSELVSRILSLPAYARRRA